MPTSNSPMHRPFEQPFPYPNHSSKRDKLSKRRNIPGFNRPKMSPFRGRAMKTTLNSRGRPFYRGRGAYKKIVTNPYERA
ncbi:RNA-binding protein, putative [Plasmodium ovale wallikeri]|uniref:RNA-binding protein, putative n=1 Tax=Plasmodium ovale wallikeri TaxID=864142 RepID=A0A1A8YPT9_PLAOA|nr:RNA-binding protein, putative [Plasmodium ovale wallikeri]